MIFTISIVPTNKAETTGRLTLTKIWLNISTASLATKLFKYPDSPYPSLPSPKPLLFPSLLLIPHLSFLPLHPFPLPPPYRPLFHLLCTCFTVVGSRIDPIVRKLHQVVLLLARFGPHDLFGLLLALSCVLRGNPWR
jgi:hypothetical protein